MKKLFMFLCVGALLLFSISAQAIPLTDEYTVEVITNQLGTYSWQFVYNITNNNQQAPGLPYTGLDGFFIVMPENAVISSVSVPAPYHPPSPTPGSWFFKIWDDDWAQYWGNEEASVYPAGTTATFSFQADGVVVGESDAVITTYWSTYEAPNSYQFPGSDVWYTDYETTLVGPAAVPEPATMLLLGSGLVGLAGFGRKKFFKRSST